MVTTDARLHVAQDDVCTKVEEVFQKQVQDKQGLAAREKFAEMLEALGLTSAEALLLLNECDPNSKSHLQYKDFLNFLFGRAQEQEKTEVAAAKIQDTIKDTKVADSDCGSGDVKPPSEPQHEPGVVDQPEQSAHSAKVQDLLKGAFGVAPKVSGVGDKVQEQLTSQIDGHWNKALISGTTVEWKSGGLNPLERISPTEVRLTMDDGESFMGELRDDGKLHWSDGDIWTKADDAGTEPEAQPDSDKDSVQTLVTIPQASTPPGIGRNVAQSKSRCSDCRQLHDEVFIDPSDDCQYCEVCWAKNYNSQPKKLVEIVKGKFWSEDRLIMGWNQNPIPGWPRGNFPSKPVTAAAGDPTNIGDHFFPVFMRLNPGLVGSHARNCSQQGDRPIPGELLCNRYRVEEQVGAGHFTRAVLAIDEQTGNRVCVKKHHSLTVELLTDLLTICCRLQSEDRDNQYFPQMFDAFYDIEGFTVESLVQGKNCLSVMRENKEHFKDFHNLRVVATQGYSGLVHMATAGVVHCYLKPDNIMWIESREAEQGPRVMLVDFGCSRLDSRLENGRNWALAECGAGHVGKWAPEMILRLPITHKADVWGLAVALLELHAGRTTWCAEADTVEVVLAQALGIVNARNGLPRHLLGQSPLDIRQLYTPHPNYFPVQRPPYSPPFGRGATFQEIRPATWGLGCVLGEESSWDETRIVFANFVLKGMNLDYANRSGADEMLLHTFIKLSAEDTAVLVEEWNEAQKIAAAQAALDAKMAAADAASVVIPEPSLSQLV
jgi:serine/threonine protein kinase